MATLFRTLGLVSADDKQDGPAEVLDFLGYDTGTVNGMITVKHLRLAQAGELMAAMAESWTTTCDEFARWRERCRGALSCSPTRAAPCGGSGISYATLRACPGPSP